MKMMIFHCEPHWVPYNGSASYTCRINATQLLRASRAVGERAGAALPVIAASGPLPLRPRLLFEHQPS